MRQVILTSFSQDTDLVTKTATAFLKFNNGELSIPVTQEALTEVIKFMAGITEQSRPSVEYSDSPPYLGEQTTSNYTSPPTFEPFEEEEQVFNVEPNEVDVQSLMNKYRNMDQINNYPPPMSKEQRKLQRNTDAPPYRDPFEGPSETTIGRYNEATGGVTDEDGFAQF